MTELKISIGPQIGSLANWYGVKISEEVQRNVTLLHRSKTKIRQPQALGHRSIGSTMQYVGTTDSQAAEAVQAALMGVF